MQRGPSSPPRERHGGMTAGVPGLAIYCLFLLSLLKRIASALCHKEDENFPGQQMLGALLAALLVYSVFEPLLCMMLPIPTLLFCLSAGLLMNEERRSEHDNPQSEAGKMPMIQIV